MKGILMTPDNAQKCHDGTKTQTRRRIKNPTHCHAYFFVDHNDKYPYYYRRRDAVWDSFQTLEELIVKRCPYQIGEKVYIKETWALMIPAGASIYAERIPHYRGAGETAPRWKPSIHMPLKAARTIVEITDIRAQRVQDISDEDAADEGVIPDPKQWDTCWIDAFIRLWDSIHGEGAWDKNSYVWALTFKVV